MTDMAQRALDAFLREDFNAFVRKAFLTINEGKPYHENWHIDAITHHLRECLDGRMPRLLITQPPRSLKSICASVAFVAWALGHDPSLQFICVSYSNTLAEELSRQFRVVVASDWYKRVFPRTRATRDTATEFVTSAGGGRFTTSVGGTLTGLGADIIIIDDPMKADDATSEAARRQVIDWYSNSLVSRLNDKTTGRIIVVMQRLHEDDLAGHLIDQGDFRHLDLPATAVEDQNIPIGPGETHFRRLGDLLHPEREPQEKLDEMKRNLGSAAYSAQYQQRPVPPDGNLLKMEWFRTYDSPPAHESYGVVLQSWDLAIKTGERNDYSVCTTWLILGQDFYLLDVLRKRVEFPELVKLYKAHCRLWSAHQVVVEDAGIGYSLHNVLAKDIHRPTPQEVRAGHRFWQVPKLLVPVGSKVDRAEMHSAYLERGHLYLPKSALWLDEFKKEVRAFPYGRHDDQVDSMTQALQYWIHERKLIRYGRHTA